MIDKALTAHMRVLEPHPGIFAYYDGRVPGQRFAPGDNWVDRGALSLGIATYAVVSEGEALVYDTHVSLAHGQAIRAHLEAQGVRSFTIVYSHWHLDHVAGTAAFAGSPVIANDRTARHLSENRAAIESGTLSGPPILSPLVLPTRTFKGEMTLVVGNRRIELRTFDIHSDDATVLWLPDGSLLLAGDTVEDCVTYVDDAGALGTHLVELDRLAALDPDRILPCHGAPDQIAVGGYRPALIAATSAYVRWLLGLGEDRGRAALPLHAVISDWLTPGPLHWFQPYEEVHRANVAEVARALGARHG